MNTTAPEDEAKTTYEWCKRHGVPTQQVYLSLDPGTSVAMSREEYERRFYAEMARLVAKENPA